MKNKKWLLVILLVVLVINMTFFVLVRLAGVDKIVQGKFSGFISETLDAKVEIGSFTFNDKQLKITDLSLENPGKFNLVVNQLYVQYNLPQLLLSNFKNLHSIKHISIYDPVLELNIETSEKKKESNEFKIPDISSYFKKLNIHNAAISVTYSNNEIRIEENWHNLNLSIKNTKKSVVTLNSGSALQDSINAVFKLNSGTVEEAQLNIKNLSLDNLSIPALSQVEFTIDLAAEYKEELLSYNGDIKKIFLSVSGKDVSATEIALKGEDKKFSAEFIELVVDGNEVAANFEIDEILSKDRSISAEISADGVFLEQYLNSINGKIDADITIHGPISDPIVEVKADSDSISAYGQNILNVALGATYQQKRADIELLHASWQDNSITGQG
ncbi:MAG: hypothetical protein KAR20_16255, partial [Candidatus Heimdallarchaeota archaeon]|nr:hypothetical protein [Candidatus Heimdallarchaeota archaeon]